MLNYLRKQGTKSNMAGQSLTHRASPQEDLNHNLDNTYKGLSQSASSPQTLKFSGCLQKGKGGSSANENFKQNRDNFLLNPNHLVKYPSGESLGHSQGKFFEML